MFSNKYRKKGVVTNQLTDQWDCSATNKKQESLLQEYEQACHRAAHKFWHCWILQIADQSIYIYITNTCATDSTHLPHTSEELKIHSSEKNAI